MNAQASLIRTFRNTMLGRFLSIGIALYILNVSIDSVDATTLHGKENLLINDIESFAELIIEEIISVEDFFKEFDDQDSESRIQTVHVLFIGIPTSALMLEPVTQCNQPPVYASYQDVQYLTSLTITSPPPEFV